MSCDTVSFGSRTFYLSLIPSTLNYRTRAISALGALILQCPSQMGHYSREALFKRGHYSREDTIQERALFFQCWYIHFIPHKNKEGEEKPCPGHQFNDMDKNITSKRTPNLHMRLVTSPGGGGGGGHYSRGGFIFSLALRDWRTIRDKALFERGL